MEHKEDTSYVEVAAITNQQDDSGQVKLFRSDGIVLIPQPTADPRDPLNLPDWRKWIILVLVSAYGCTAVVLASGMGPIFSMIAASYPGQEAKANDLLTYPTLLMGLGNLIAVPLAMTLGRRVVFLGSIVVLLVGGLACPLTKTLDGHIAARAIMALGAGPSEALAPLIVQEIHFLHQKGRRLGWFIFIQNISAGTFFCASPYICSALGWRWWYGVFTLMNAVIFVLSVIWLTETDYSRPIQDTTTPGQESDGKEPLQYTTANPIILDYDIYGERTLRHDLRLLNGNKDPRQIVTFYRTMLQSLFIPPIFWLFLLNGSFLGIYIFEASTFSKVLMAPPYSFSFESLGYVQAGQIVVCLIFLPLLGYGSDCLIKILSKRNGGHYKPEYRLLPLIPAAIVGVICAILYGEAGASPTDWSVSAPVITYNASFFAFLGANVVAITYAVDSFPDRAEAALTVICAGRGIVSFGQSYGVLPSIEAIGYDGAMIVQASIAGALSVLGIVFYWAGPKIRKQTKRILKIE